MVNIKQQLIERGGDYGYVAPGTRMPEGMGAPKPAAGGPKEQLMKKMIRTTLTKKKPAPAIPKKGVDELKQKYA